MGGLGGFFEVEFFRLGEEFINISEFLVELLGFEKEFDCAVLENIGGFLLVAVASLQLLLGGGFVIRCSS